MWAAHESCFLFILAAGIFLELELDKRGILWYNISIMGSIHPFVAASLRLLLLLRPYYCCCCSCPIRYPGWVQSHVKFSPLIFRSGKKLICCCLRGGNTSRPIFAASCCCLWGLPQDQTEPPPRAAADEVASDIETRRKMKLGLDKSGVAW